MILDPNLLKHEKLVPSTISYVVALCLIICLCVLHVTDLLYLMIILNWENASYMNICMVEVNKQSTQRKEGSAVPTVLEDKCNTFH